MSEKVKTGEGGVSGETGAGAARVSAARIGDRWQEVRLAGLAFGPRFTENASLKWHQVRQICLTWLIYPCPAGRGHPSPKMSPSVFIMSHEGAKAGGGRGSGMPGSY